jgi:four helix bundle protein
MQDYHQLEIWQRGMAYASEVYRLAALLPDFEKYNLASQLRRAATSVPLNIAEGAGCSGRVEFAKFLGYAYRSTKEVVTALELCRLLHPMLPADVVTGLVDEGNRIARMTHALMSRLGRPADVHDS